MTSPALKAARWLPIALASSLAVVASVGARAAGHDGVSSQTLTDIWDGVYTAEQADRGQKTFVASCGACHGDDLNGTEDGPSLRNAGFFARWRGQTMGTIVASAMKTMPKGAPGSLSVGEYVDIASFLLRTNGLPAGKIDLPQDIRSLRVITVTDAPHH